jgi:hypothetical protein
LASIDLLTGGVHALIKDRHRSREFIEFPLDAAYPVPYRDQIDPRQSFRPHLLADQQPVASNSQTRLLAHLVEGFFSKLARSVLRHIRVASKTGTQGSHHGCLDHFDQEPIVHAWSYSRLI